MKKVFMLASAAALATLIALPSCKKKEDDPAATRSQMAVGTWKTTQVGDDANHNGTWDASEHYTATGDSSVTIVFNSNATGTVTYSLLGTPLSIPMNWNLQNSDNDIRIITPSLQDTTILNILSFSSSDCVVRDADSTTSPRYMALKKQ